MVEPISAIELGLTAIEKAWEVIKDVREAGENTDQLNMEVKSFENILKCLEKDRQLNAAKAEVLDFPIERCNNVIKDITKGLGPFPMRMAGQIWDSPRASKLHGRSPGLMKV